ncbi:hypothetical protein L6164_036358 [Bauhinia variegata]|uniref:Uncharacterized protein n=1 Tax=Bauhinia variegata TaxID=167791 RepID=A0ACB9KHL5_BAUVA|nr:hypothetical protein L6164_036358 [Bauhinia variegata]
MASLLHPPLQPNAADYSEPNNTSGIVQTMQEIITPFDNEAIEFSSRSIQREEQGMQVTWEDLRTIMGPSGCGKSTLLDALAGRLASNARQTGKVLINGCRQALAYGTSAYVTEDDAILATLTVGEAVYYSALLQLPDSMSKSEKKKRADFTIREMGMQDVINTRIGRWGYKGVSGGKKRRVSICIEILTHPRLLFLDEPTSGLDSAASYYVMSRITCLNQKDDIQRTIIASIHQPSSEIFQLFHNICLLSSGKVVYFGPVSAANKFFASNGFPCSTLQSPSDHFVKTINNDFDQDPEKGLSGGSTIEEAIEILVQSYKSSEIFQQVQKEVVEIRKKDSDAIEKKSHAAFLTQCLILTRRSFVNIYREVDYYWLRILLYGALALSLGTMFYDIGSSSESVQARGSLLVFVVTFLTFITVGGFPSLVEEMKQGLDHLIYFISVLFVSVLLVESLMMIVAIIVPTFLMGIISCSGILGVMMLDGGFYRLPKYIPKPFWRYPLYYISFHKYAYQGLFKNEFQGLTFTGVVVLDRILFLLIIKSIEKVKPAVAAINWPQEKFKFTKVFEQERLNGHYGATAFLIGNTLSAAPYMLLISLIPGGIVSYLSGLHKRFEHFVYSTFVLFATVMSVESLTMAVGSVFPNFIMGMIINGGIQGLMILIGGFYCLTNDLPKPFWRYPLYYVFFHKYAFQGLFKNEFDGLRFSSDQGSSSKTISGNAILKQKW